MFPKYSRGYPTQSEIVKNYNKYSKILPGLFKYYLNIFYTQNRGAASGCPPKGAAAFGRRPLWVLYFVCKIIFK